MIVIKHLLVATDFGDAADTALAYGRDIARTYAATLHLLHVENDIATRYALDMGPVFEPDLQKQIDEAALRRVEALVTAEDREQLRARAVLRSSNTPATAIVAYAKEEDIDLIIVGTHGRGVISHLFMGSVAERVVRTAPCPVLTVRHPARGFLVPDALTTTTKV